MDIRGLLEEELRAWKEIRSMAIETQELGKKVKKQTEFVVERILPALAPFRSEALTVSIGDELIVVGETIRRAHKLPPSHQPHEQAPGLIKKHWRSLAPYVDEDIRGDFEALGKLLEQFTLYDEVVGLRLSREKPGWGITRDWRIADVEKVAVELVDALSGPLVAVFVCFKKDAPVTYPVLVVYPGKQDLAIPFNTLGVRHAIEELMRDLRDEVRKAVERNQDLLNKMLDIVGPRLVTDELTK